MPQESYYLFFSDNHCNTTSSTSNPVKTTRLSNIVASVAKEFSCPVIFGGDVYDIGLGAKKITETNPDITVETLEKTLLEDSRGVYKQFNEDFEGVELAGIPGNHDTQAIYDAIPNMHFLNKGAPKTIGGIRFAGAINAYETKMMSIDGKKPLDIIVEDDDISGVDLTQFKEARSQMEQDLKKKFGDKVNPEALAKIIDYNLKIQLGAQSPVYQKLKDEEFDVLVSHKGGLNTGMTISGQGEIDSGYGVSRLLEERNMANKPITSLCGHFHSGLYSIKGQQLNLRGSPGVFYGVGTTEQGDRFVDVFEVVEGAAKGIIEEYKRQGFTFQPTEDVQKAA